MKQVLNHKDNNKRMDGIKLFVGGIALLSVAVFIVLQSIMHMMNTPEEQEMLINQSASILPMYVIFGIVFVIGVIFSIFGYKKLVNNT